MTSNIVYEWTVCQSYFIANYDKGSEQFTDIPISWNTLSKELLCKSGNTYTLLPEHAYKDNAAQSYNFLSTIATLKRRRDM